MLTAHLAGHAGKALLYTGITFGGPEGEEPFSPQSPATTADTASNHGSVVTRQYWSHCEGDAYKQSFLLGCSAWVPKLTGDSEQRTASSHRAPGGISRGLCGCGGVAGPSVVEMHMLANLGWSKRQPRSSEAGYSEAPAQDKKPAGNDRGGL